MEFWIFVLVFLLGVSIGSFVNAWSFRYGTGRSILAPSSCFSCGRRLAWYELFPIASFLALRGKCRTCRVKLSLQYPIVELITGIVFVLIFWKLQISDFSLESCFLFLASFSFWSLIIAISVYDFREKIIPDGAVYSAAALALISNPKNFLAGIILAAPLAAFWFFSRGRWMGFGDAKLQLGLGFLLGLSVGFSGLLFGFWLGALAGVFLMIIKKAGMKTELPFGPFLALGAFIAWLANFNVMIYIWNAGFL